jgi:hypothetical protein
VGGGAIGNSRQPQQGGADKKCNGPQ